ncbi:MAG: NAD(P)-binding protein [Promethearchaeota archaeon]
MYDIIVIGAGICGASFAYKASKYAKVLLIEAQDYNKKIPERVNIFAEHNKPFIDDLIWKDEEVFPRPWNVLNYKSEKNDGLIDYKEFGKPLGKISHTEKFIEKLIQYAEDQGCDTRFNEKISKINKHGDHVEIINNKGESYSTKLFLVYKDPLVLKYPIHIWVFILIPMWMRTFWMRIFIFNTCSISILI